MSLCEPVLLVDSRMPYGAVIKTQVSSCRKVQTHNDGTSLFKFEELTIGNDGVKKANILPHRLGCIRHHHIYIHVFRSVLPQVGPDVLVRSSPFLIFPARSTWNREENIEPCVLPKRKRSKNQYLTHLWAIKGSPQPTSSMNCVVIDISSTDVGSKLWAGDQKASWKKEKAGYVLQTGTEFSINHSQSSHLCLQKGQRQGHSFLLWHGWPW